MKNATSCKGSKKRGTNRKSKRQNYWKNHNLIDYLTKVCSMKSYAITFTLKPGVRIDPRINLPMDFTFNEKDGAKRVLIDKIEDNVHDKPVQTGLSFKVLIEGSSVAEAKEKAKGFIDGVVGFLTLTSGVGLQIPIENVAYEQGSNMEREFLQVFFNPAGLTVSRRKHLTMRVLSRL